MPQIQNVDFKVDHSPAGEDSAKVKFDVLFWESELKAGIPFTCDVYLYDKEKRMRTYYRKLNNPRAIAHVEPFPGHLHETDDYVAVIARGKDIDPSEGLMNFEFEGKVKLPGEKKGMEGYQALISLYPKMFPATAWIKEKKN